MENQIDKEEIPGEPQESGQRPTLDNEWEIDNLPNRLTMFRVVLIPVIIASLFLCTFTGSWIKPYHLFLGYLAGWTFVVAAVTDFLDGYIARKRKIVTVFGSFLDPIADKFLVVSSLILLMGLNRIPILVVIILVLREMYITALRLLAMQKGLKVPVGKLGKWKTACQMIGVPMLMAYDNWHGFSFPFFGSLFIYISTIISVYSAMEYSFGLLQKIKAKRKTKNVS